MCERSKKARPIENARQLPRNVEDICRQEGREWADRPEFSDVVNWLNASPGAIQPPLRYLLNLTHRYAQSQNTDEERLDLLQSFWYDSRNGYQQRIRGSYRPRPGLSQEDLHRFFWSFLTTGLHEFCRRTKGAQKKEEQKRTEHGMTFIPSHQEDADGQTLEQKIEDTNPMNQPEAALQHKMQGEWLENAVRQLPPLECKVFKAWRDAEADDNQNAEANDDQRKGAIRRQIAADLDLTVSHFNVILFRSRRLLKKRLDEEDLETDSE